ncbi:UNVERIFIED_CONTAM: hypothetical protein K2H54_019079 [Gekko kuhli]
MPRDRLWDRRGGLTASETIRKGQDWDIFREGEVADLLSDLCSARRAPADSVKSPFNSGGGSEEGDNEPYGCDRADVGNSIGVGVDGAFSDVLVSEVPQTSEEASMSNLQDWSVSEIQLTNPIGPWAPSRTYSRH